METVDIVVIIMAAIASLTKLIDILSTIKFIKGRAMGERDAIPLERNPLGRLLFRHFGVVGGCWVTFVIWTLVCMVSAWEVNYYGYFALKIGVIVFYGLLTYLNVWAGIYNMIGRTDPFTRIIIKFYSWLGRKMKKH